MLMASYVKEQESLLLVGTGHLSLCLGRIVFMWVGLSNLLKVREPHCVLMGHSLAPLLMMWKCGGRGCELIKLITSGLFRAYSYTIKHPKSI